MTKKQQTKSKKDKQTSQEQMQQQIEQLQNQVETLTDSFNRARADYVNLEKRMTAQQGQFVKLASATILAKMLNLLDNLERAAEHIDDPGLEMVIKDFYKLLAEEGATPIEAEGQDFDPQTMECVERVDGPANKVVAVVKSGYWLDKHLIRPAQVTVGAVNSNLENKNETTKQEANNE